MLYFHPGSQALSQAAGGGDMTRTVLTLVLLSSATIWASTSSADVLLIEEVRHIEGMAVPGNGTSMSDVEAQHGSPGSKQGPVGDPPITQWVYDRWSVYFEYDKVLFTVLHKGEVINTGPVAAEGQP